jgi:hypothetical protein
MRWWFIPTIIGACAAAFYFTPPVGWGAPKPVRPIFTLYSDEWTCTKPTPALDDLGRVICQQFTAKGVQ